MKTIYVPKDSLAKQKLDYNQCEADDLIELILDDDIFYKLFNDGFFESINQLTKSNIDNFEDEEITDYRSLQKVIESPLFDRNSYDENLFKTVSAIKFLFNEALLRNTGIFFFF